MKYLKGLLTGSIFAMAFVLAGFVAHDMARPVPEATTCDSLPTDSVVLALGFLHQGRSGDRVIPGRANRALARLLEKCGHRMKLVLTQKAVSDALEYPRLLMSQTRVEQMHADSPDLNIRTFAALEAALARLTTKPDALVLLAHPGHLARARMDLEAMYKGRIIIWQPGDIGFQDGKWYRGPLWSIKNMLGWAMDSLVIAGKTHPLIRETMEGVDRFFGLGLHAPPASRLGPIDFT